MRAAVLALAVASLGCGSEPETQVANDEGRGVRVIEAPLQATPEPPPVQFRQPRDRTPGTVVPAAPPPPAAAPVADGGLPASDGGPVPTDDHALAATVEAQGRTFAQCFPVTMTALPEVSLEFQISVTGIVTRNDVRGDAVPDDVRQCLSSAAAGIRFPAQTTSRSYRYPLRLRRTPRPDGGTAAARTDGGR